MDIDTYCTKLEPFINIIKIGIIPLFNIGVPLILIALGSFDLSKAVASGDENNIKSSQKMLIRRIVLGVAVFFVPLLISLIFTMVDEAIEEEPDEKISATSWIQCWSDTATEKEGNSSKELSLEELIEMAREQEIANPDSMTEEELREALGL